MINIEEKPKYSKNLVDIRKLHRYNDKACVIRSRVLLKSVKSGNILQTGGEKHANI